MFWLPLAMGSASLLQSQGGGGGILDSFGLGSILGGGGGGDSGGSILSGMGGTMGGGGKISADQATSSGYFTSGSFDVGSDKLSPAIIGIIIIALVIVISFYRKT